MEAVKALQILREVISHKLKLFLTPALINDVYEEDEDDAMSGINKINQSPDRQSAVTS